MIMAHYGFGFGMMLMQMFCFLLAIAWIVVCLVALFSLKKNKISPTAKALWVMILIGVPVLGVAAYFIIKPSDEV